MKTEMPRRILIFGGTTEGRNLTRSGLPIIYSAVTAYGAKLIEKMENVEIITGRMTSHEMEKFIRESNIAGVIDATHPYAREAHDNIRAACTATDTPIARVRRKESSTAGNDIVSVGSIEEAARYIEGTAGNVLLTTGSKDIGAFASIRPHSRLFARVLPDPDVIKKCAEHGFDSGHIIAMQGPFSLLMNEEMMRMTNAEWLVTKNSGNTGGIKEKIEAARNCKVRIIMIKRPFEENTLSFEEVLPWARKILDYSIPDSTTDE